MSFFLKMDACATFPVVLEMSTSKKASFPLELCSCVKFIDFMNAVYYAKKKKD